MENRDRPIAPHSPWQNGYAERLTGCVPSDRSGASASTISWSSVNRPCASPSGRTPATTTRSERTGRCTRIRRKLVRFSSPERSAHTPCSADSIIITFEFRFSIHTTASAAYLWHHSRLESASVPERLASTASGYLFHLHTSGLPFLSFARQWVEHTLSWAMLPTSPSLQRWNSTLSTNPR